MYAGTTASGVGNNNHHHPHHDDDHYDETTTTTTATIPLEEEDIDNDENFKEKEDHEEQRRELFYNNNISNTNTTTTSLISPRFISYKRNHNDEEGNLTNHHLKVQRSSSNCSSSSFDQSTNPINFLSYSISNNTNNNWTKSFLRRRYWFLVMLFILLALTFMMMGLWIILSLSKKDETFLIEQIVKQQRESMIVSKKILSRNEKLERTKRKQLIVKDYIQSLNHYLLSSSNTSIDGNSQTIQSNSVLDLIVFTTDTGGGNSMINRNKLNKFISENVLYSKGEQFKSRDRIRIHLVNHSKNRNLNLQTVKKLMESYHNSWLIIGDNENSKFTLLPSIMYPPYHALISNFGIMDHEFFSSWINQQQQEGEEMNFKIPINNNNWKERFRTSTEFWSNILIERIGSQVVEADEPSLHMADMENIVRRNRLFESLLEMDELSEMETVNQFQRFDILKSIDECNVLHFINVEKEKTKLEESMTLFLYRFRRVLQHNFSLFITNNKTLYSRALLFMPKVLLMQDKRLATIVANLHCLTNNNGKQFMINGISNHHQKSLASSSPLSQMMFSRQVSKNNIETIQYFKNTENRRKKNSKIPSKSTNIQLNIGIQVEYLNLKGVETIVKELAQYLTNSNVKVTIINCSGEKKLFDTTTTTPPTNTNTIGSQIPPVSIKQIQSKSEYKQLLQNEKFAIINAHHSTFGLEIAKELNIPIVQTLHNQYMWLLEEKQKKILERFYRADQYTSLYTSVSSDVSIFSDLNLGLDINKMVVIRNGISSDQLKDCPISMLKSHEREMVWMNNILPHTLNSHVLPFNRTTNYFVISQLDSEISPSMGHHISILALSHLKKKLQKEKKKPLLIISGKFTSLKFKNLIEKLIVEHDVQENVLFMRNSDGEGEGEGGGGDENSKDLECSLLKYSDTLLHPSLMEGWSTQLARAVIYDKDVVATFNAGASEILSHQYVENGLTTAVAKLASIPSSYHKIKSASSGGGSGSSSGSGSFDFEEFIGGESNLEFEHSISESLYHLFVGRMLHPKKEHSIPISFYAELMNSFVYEGYKKLFELIVLTGNNVEVIRHLFGQTYR